MTSFQGVQPRIFWGLNTSIRGNINYITDLDVLYPAGGVLILHNYVQQTQAYIKLPEPQKVLTMIAVSPNKKTIAIAEEGEKPCISLYDVKSMKRKKVLGLPFESSAKEFVSIAFTFDSKYLVAIVGEPDWMMLYYNWEKGKVESQTRANNPPANTGPVIQVAPNPTDSAVVVIVGPGLFRLLSVSDTVWRQYGFQKADKLPIKCVSWMSSDRVLAGTEDDRLIIIEYGDLRGKYKASEVLEFDLQILEDQSGAVNTSVSSSGVLHADTDPSVNCVLAFSNGFAYSIANYIIVFEKETKFRYRRKNVFVIETPDMRQDLAKSMNIIHNLAVSPAQDRILATTLQSQIYYAHLLTKDLPSLAETAVKMMCLGESLHHGPISGLALCAWKTIFMTCGELDHTVRVWDFTTESLILTKHYEEEIFSVALHPTGLYAVVGFSDKLRYMLVLLDDLNMVREFSIRTCRKAAFSNSGHMFAAVNSTTIQVFCSITFHCVYYLKGHNATINSLIWVANDKSLFSCGSDGAIYEWNMFDGSRINDVITKECMYLGITTTQDGKVVYGVGSDGLLKEMTNGEVLREESFHHSCLFGVTLSRSDLMMFVTGTKGAILSIRYPMPRPPEYSEFYLHNDPVTKMSLTYDDQNLITCSNDGSMCIWKLVNTERKCVKMDSEFSYSKEILINKDDLGEKLAMIKYLENLVKSLETDHAYQIKEMETEHTDKINELHSGYCTAIQDLKDKNQELIAEHTIEINKMNNSILEMKREDMAATEKLESSYNAKLIIEYNKYAELKDVDQRERDELYSQLEDLMKSKEDALKEMSEMYEDKLKLKDVVIQELNDTMKLHSAEHEEIKRQIEEDADQEIIDLRTQFEQALRIEKDNNLRLRGEIGVMKKKFLSAQKEIDELKHQVNTLLNEHHQLKSEIGNREQDINNLKKEIEERDYTIQENERRFSEVKNSNQELEKFKFVLNHKIMELQKQIQPKEEEIQQKKEQIQDMEEEFDDHLQTISRLILQITELKESVLLKEKEFTRERGMNKELQAILRRLRSDLHNAAALVQEPDNLKKAVVNMYHKYGKEKEFEHRRLEDREAMSEFMRQRNHLENTVTRLRQMCKKSMAKDNNADKMMKDNVILIEEINFLRKDLAEKKKHILNIESIIGIHKFITPHEAQRKLELAVQTRESIHSEYKYKIKELEEHISLLRSEIDKLKSKTLEDKSKVKKLDWTKSESIK